MLVQDFEGQIKKKKKSPKWTGQNRNRGPLQKRHWHIEKHQGPTQHGQFKKMHAGHHSD